MRIRIAAAIAVLAVVSVGPAARAEVFVGPGDPDIRPVHYRAVVSHRADSTTLIQTVEVDSRAARFGWLKPFPAPPEISVESDISFETLDQQTRIRAPYNYAVRDNLFGPSSVSWWLAALATRGPGRNDAATDAQPRRLEVTDAQIFEGRVQTSTITGKMIVPAALQAWCDQRGIVLSEITKSSFAGVLNRRWVLVGLDVVDRAPSRTATAITPPVRFRFPSKFALLPLLRQPRALPKEPPFAVWTLADRRLASSTFPTEWISRPWEEDRGRPGRFEGVFSRAVEARDALTETLSRSFDLQLPPTPQLVRYRFRHGIEIWQELGFTPAVDAPDIPGFGGRGSISDVLLCLLLGLTPLLFSPESWFLLWLGGRTNDTGWVKYLWPTYAIIVAGYWFVRLDGVGRLAGLLPLAIAAYQMFGTTEEQRRDFVRVQFKRKAKASSS